MLPSKLRNAAEWTLMVAVVFGLGAIAQAQEDGDSGRIVRIGPASDTEVDQRINEDVPRTWESEEQPRPEASSHWIGVMAGPVTPALRAHLDIPEGQGIMVHQVVPDSPAAEAGLKQYDILLRANDTELRDNRDLVDVVRAAGDQQQQITMEVLRGPLRETAWVTPAERPARPISPGSDVGEENHDFRFEGGNNPFGWFGENFREGFGDEFGPRGPNTFRRFGPGAVLGGRMFGGHVEIPNGVSVSINKQSDEPAHITVERGDETWEVVGDDPESLEQLPDDVRPFVEQLLTGPAHGGFGNFTLPVIPNPPAVPGAPPVPPIDGDHEARLQQRFEAMEQRMRELEQRLQGQWNDAQPADTK